MSKTELLSLRVDPTALDLYQAAAADTGLTLQAWVRRRLADAAWADLQQRITDE